MPGWKAAMRSCDKPPPLTDLQKVALCELAAGARAKPGRWVAAESMVRKGYAARSSGGYELTAAGIELLQFFEVALLYRRRRAEKWLQDTYYWDVYSVFQNQKAAVAAYDRIVRDERFSLGCWLGPLPRAAYVLAHPELTLEQVQAMKED